MVFSRIVEKIDNTPCSSDGMRLDAWRVALQGTRDNLFLPASEPYSEYYSKSAIGIRTSQECHAKFITVHNFYLEQLYMGGIIWLLVVLTLFYKAIVLSRGTIFGFGFVTFVVFLGFSPTYPQFYPLLLSFLFLIYTKRVGIIRQ